jgi:deoxycytidylate deaminase
LKGYEVSDTQDAQAQLRRYLRLLFGYKDITPTREEYGMFLAQSAAYRSADLSRQVGAAILTQTSEVVSLGANEVPSYGGGQYWTTSNSKRDFEVGKDENAKIKFENLEELVAIIVPNWESKTPTEKEKSLAEMSLSLKNTRMMNLTEFGRAVHAEMDALLSAGRIGISVKGCDLFCTTFPCHNCAKHIITAGIRRVLYIESYPKSLAAHLHGDAITMGSQNESENKVAFEPFRGVAPRMYSTLFSSMNSVGKRIKRKTNAGDIDPSAAGLRTKAFPLSYIEREAAVALHLLRMFPEAGNASQDTESNIPESNTSTKEQIS